MAPFEQLQELWQRQGEVPAAQLADVTRLLGAYGRRQNWINAGKTVVVCAILGFCFYAARHEPARVAGVAIVAIAAGSLLAHEWRTQQAIARGDLAAPTLGFLDATIAGLLAQRSIRRSYYWTLMAAAVAGENLMLHGSRIWLRVAASLAPFAGLEVGLWVRRRRFDYECAPLLRQLRAVRSALEDRPE